MAEVRCKRLLNFRARVTLVKSGSDREQRAINVIPRYLRGVRSCSLGLSGGGLRRVGNLERSRCSPKRRKHEPNMSSVKSSRMLIAQGQ